MKGNLLRLSTRVLNTPLMIDPDKLNVILGVIGPRIGLSIEELKAQQIEWPEDLEEQKTEEEGKLAIIPVHGTLVQRTGGLDSLSGLRSYEGIRTDFREAMGDSDIKGIVFDMDSPGGEVAGIFDLADEIYEARGKKPIFAVANEMAYSAAYLLASAAEKVYLSRTAGMGSIGVIAVHVDQSKWDEKQGLTYTPVYAGVYKNDFSVHKPLSDHGKEVIQADVNEIYEMFIETVARNRGLKSKDIRKQEAGVFQGETVIKEGLADSIMSWEQAISDIKQITSGKGGKKMEITLKLLETDAPDLLKEIQEKARTEVTVESFKEQTEKMTNDAAKAEHDRIISIFEKAYGKEMAEKFAKICAPDASMTDMMEFATDKAKTEMLQKMQASSPESLGTDDLENDELDGAEENEEKWKKEYAKDKNLQAEFPEEGEYLAYKKAHSEGRAKILKSKEE